MVKSYYFLSCLFIFCFISVLTGDEKETIDIKGGIVSKTIHPLGKDTAAELVLSVYPTEIYVGDTVYYSVEIRNNTYFEEVTVECADIAIRIGLPDQKEYRCHQEDGSGMWYRHQWGTVLPDKKMVIAYGKVRIPLRFQRDEAFWENLLNSNSKEITLTFNHTLEFSEFRQKENASIQSPHSLERISKDYNAEIKFPVHFIPRPQKEQEPLLKMMKESSVVSGEPPEESDKRGSGVGGCNGNQLSESGKRKYADIKPIDDNKVILFGKDCNPYLFLIPYKEHDNVPFWLKDCQKLPLYEKTFTTGTLHDEIRFYRLLIDYCNAKDKPDSEKKLSRLVRKLQIEFII